ncbi:MAG: hypothetical protein GY778_07415, partial [bacterium]|nr:hypothetical protein [bacterium]
MRRLKTLLAILVAFPSCEALADGPAEVSLDGEWDFAWTPPVGDEVPTVPAAGAFEVRAEVPGGWDDQSDRFTSASWWKDAQFTTTMGPVRYLTGIGWYRRTLDVPAAWGDRAVRLTIGWAVGQVHVWLNAEHIGRYDYAVYTPFTVDLTN